MRLGIPGVCVLGNHEYYQGVFPQALATAQAAIPVDSGLHLLECNQEAFGDVRFLGCTLWTDFALLGKERMDKAKSAAGTVLANYEGVITKPGGGKLRVRDTIAAHHQARRWLQRQLATTWPGKTVVVTHHGPHRQTAHPGFGDAASAGFVSHIAELIRRHRIDLWVSGHTHYNHDFVDAGTRFVSNQRRYPGESVPGHRFDPALVIEI